MINRGNQIDNVGQKIQEQGNQMYREATGKDVEGINLSQIKSNPIPTQIPKALLVLIAMKKIWKLSSLLNEKTLEK